MICQHCKKDIEAIGEAERAFNHKHLLLCVSCAETLLIDLWEWDQNTDRYVTECLSK